MRFRSCEHYVGEERIREGFLWLPRTSPAGYGKLIRETRWLEKAKWREKLYAVGGWYLLEWL